MSVFPVSSLSRASHRLNAIVRKLTTHCLQCLSTVTWRPCRVGGTGDGVTAKDAAGNDVKSSEWVKTHNVGTHNDSVGDEIHWS